MGFNPHFYPHPWCSGPYTYMPLNVLQVTWQVTAPALQHSLQQQSSTFLWILGCLSECNARFQCKYFKGNVAAQVTRVSPLWAAGAPQWPGDHTLPSTLPENPSVIKFPQHSVIKVLSPRVWWWCHHHSPTKPTHSFRADPSFPDRMPAEGNFIFTCFWKAMTLQWIYVHVSGLYWAQ